MHRVGLVLVLVSACFAQQPQQRAEQVCNSFCGCLAPAGVQSCVDNDCLPALPQGVSDNCFDCVNQHEASCTSLETSCMATCFSSAQP
jgi:hypothetical protein